MGDYNKSGSGQDFTVEKQKEAGAGGKGTRVGKAKEQMLPLVMNYALSSSTVLLSGPSIAQYPWNQITVPSWCGQTSPHRA